MKTLNPDIKFRGTGNFLPPFNEDFYIPLYITISDFFSLLFGYAKQKLYSFASYHYKKKQGRAVYRSETIMKGVLSIACCFERTFTIPLLN